MEPALGSLKTFTPAFDAKQKQNQNAANDRKLRNPNTPPERFVMPGQQQVQAQMQGQRRQQLESARQAANQTFANMQKQGMARPAPPVRRPQVTQDMRFRFEQAEQPVLRELNKQLTAPIPQIGPQVQQLSEMVARQMNSDQMRDEETERLLRELGRPQVQQPGTTAIPMGQQPVLTAQAQAPAAPTAAPAAPAAPAPSLPQQVAQQLAAPVAAPAAPGLQQQVAQQVGAQPVAAQPQQVAQQPAQPAAQPQQPAAPSAVGSDLQQQLQQQLLQLTQAPSAYGTEQIQQMREAQRADIEAQFGAQRSQLEEELARRGLSASSIAAGQFGDLAGQQARAIATAEAGLTEKAAESLQRGREQAIQGLAQAAGVELESKGLDLQSKKVQADIEAETKRLMQADRSLDLTQARDQAQERIAFANLAEQAKDRASRERISMADLNQRSSQFAAQLGLDRDRFNDSITARAEEFARRDRSLDLETARWMATEERERETLAEQQYQFDQTFGLRAAESATARELDQARLAQILASMLTPGAAPAPQLGGGGSGGFGGGGGSNNMNPYDLIGGFE